jgi:hypothetical protein
MSIQPKCDKCQQELQDFGGILLSPPDGESKVIKYHLCKDCYKEIEDTLKL